MISTALWILDNSIFHSIQLKLDMWLFADFCFFPRIYMSWIWTCFEHQNRTILGSAHVKLGENTEINKQSHVNCQVLAKLNKIWSCLIFIKLCLDSNANSKRIFPLYAPFRSKCPHLFWLAAIVREKQILSKYRINS